MNDKELTDNEIVEAMKRCIASDCEETGCPLYNEADTYAMCVTILLEKTLDLINRQKAEIDRLTSTQEILKKRLDNCLHFAEENVEFEKENRDLLLRLKQCDTEIESLKIPLEVSMAKLGDARAELQKAEEEIERKDRILESYALQYGTATDKEVFLQKARAKAIREFAELLKQNPRKLTEYDEGGWDCTVYAVTVEDIDNLVNEMTEETS